MLKLKVNHTPRDVKTLTDQLVDGTERALASGVQAVGSVTLVPGTTETTVADAKITSGSVAVLTPQHASAVGVGYWLSYSPGSLTIHHGSAVTANRTFQYVVFGS